MKFKIHDLIKKDQTNTPPVVDEKTAGKEAETQPNDFRKARENLLKMAGHTPEETDEILKVAGLDVKVAEQEEAAFQKIAEMVGGEQSFEKLAVAGRVVGQYAFFEFNDLLNQKIAMEMGGFEDPAAAGMAPPAAPAVPEAPGMPAAPGAAPEAGVGGELDMVQVLAAIKDLLADPNSVNDPEKVAAIAQLLAVLPEDALQQLQMEYPVVGQIINQAMGMA